MKKINLLLLILIFSIIAFFFIIVNQKFNSNSYVIINNHKFIVDVAKTNEQKQLGLDIYNKLPIFKGMVFPFQTADKYSFWMKGMKFPIDIIYINNSRIVEIFTNLPFPKTSTENPVTVTPKEQANYVLEINAGLSQKYNFKKGDNVIIHL